MTRQEQAKTTASYVAPHRLVFGGRVATAFVPRRRVIGQLPASEGVSDPRGKGLRRRRLPRLQDLRVHRISAATINMSSPNEMSAAVRLT